ncbi:Dps family protein [Streptomyces corynorhini]|uniref:DNA starvation/stationary phase protection protein n=1 Tax=Streptomyces corynorhini TaxID=2282652 RepID=A0A370BDA0_9ACTN|nr:DNA starvation/stationary phase protection protein [Streptomyces corynorhini]RDG37773.1 DNA starvation/stationary phase protection protein [Streptomyces corynorhini]
MSSQSDPQYTVPGMTASEGGETIQSLRMRLHALNDLALTLKHVHWNVVGPHFIAVHEMLDPQVDAVRGMVDEIAERISTLGGSPAGTPGALVSERGWDDYAVGRAEAIEHLGALDIVYSGIIADHRRAADAVAKLDPVTQDMLIQHLRGLELFQWFIRAHLESAGGTLSTGGRATEVDAAAAAGAQALRRP